VSPAVRSRKDLPWASRLNPDRCQGRLTQTERREALSGPLRPAATGLKEAGGTCLYLEAGVGIEPAYTALQAAA
jgi:hypothetical protein